MGVVQRKHDMDKGPGRQDGYKGQAQVESLEEPVRLFDQPQLDNDGSQARDAGKACQPKYSVLALVIQRSVASYRVRRGLRHHQGNGKQKRNRR